MNETLKQGDIILIKTDHFVAKLIRFGQRSYGKEHAKWNHVAIYVHDYPNELMGIQPAIVEALTQGVALNPLSKYKPEEYQIISAPCQGLFAGEDNMAESVMRHNAAVFATKCVGEKYGFMTILAIAFKTLTRGKIEFKVQGTSICSGLAARCLERMGYNFNPWDPAELTPAFLSKTFKEDRKQKREEYEAQQYERGYP